MKREGVDGGRGVCSGPLALRGGLKRASVRSMSWLTADLFPQPHAQLPPRSWGPSPSSRVSSGQPGTDPPAPPRTVPSWPSLSMAHQRSPGPSLTGLLSAWPTSAGRDRRARVGTSSPGPTLGTSSSAWPFLFSSLAPGGHFLQGVTTGCCFLSPDPSTFWTCKLPDLGLWDPLDNCLLASPFLEAVMPGPLLGT